MGERKKYFKNKWLGAALHYVHKFWPENSEDSSIEEGLFTDEDEVEKETQAWVVGQELEAKWTDGNYYWGKVAKCYKNGKYNFHFDDKDILRLN